MAGYKGMKITLKYPVVDGFKECSKCEKTKPVEDFFFQNGKPRAFCKICNTDVGREWKENNKERNSLAKKKWRENNPAHHRSHMYKQKYGITIEDYDKLYCEQNGVCDICGEKERVRKTKHLSVDHNHETGKVRGLLCFNCNNALGCMQDSVENLQKAIDYLNKHNEKQ